MNILFGFVFVLGAAVNFLFFYKPMLSSNGIQYITAVCLSLMLAGLGTLWLYIIVKFALIKTKSRQIEVSAKKIISALLKMPGDFLKPTECQTGRFLKVKRLKRPQNFLIF